MAIAAAGALSPFTRFILVRMGFLLAGVSYRRPDEDGVGVVPCKRVCQTSARYHPGEGDLLDGKAAREIADPVAKPVCL